MRRSSLAALIAWPLIGACSGANGEAAPKSTTSSAGTAAPDTVTLSAQAVRIGGFTVDTVRRQPWRNAITVPARLMLDPASVETIGSIVEGRITHVLVRVGDAVKAGDVLVMIHSHEITDARSAQVRARSQLSAADAERTVAVAAAERAHRLFDAKAMSRADVERADAARATAVAMYEQAFAERERADAMIEHLVGSGPIPANADPHDVLIRTPISGVVITRDAQPGTVVLPGSSLITVGDPARVLLQLRLTESAAHGVREGTSIRFALTDDPTQPHEAAVTRIAPTVDTLTRTIEVQARPIGSLGIGRAESFAQADVAGADGTPAVVVPTAALQALEGDTVVIAAERRGSALFIEAKPVRVGRRSADQVELLSGIAVGQTVLTTSAAIAKAELLKRRTNGTPE